MFGQHNSLLFDRQNLLANKNLLTDKNVLADPLFGQQNGRYFLLWPTNCLANKLFGQQIVWPTQCLADTMFLPKQWLIQGILKGESITVPLTSCLTGLD
jgi:hypothetical protein